MSSLAAARADNFYYPPGFDPDKHGSLNKVCMQPPHRLAGAVGAPVLMLIDA
jgi:hypothetical protein